MDMAESKKDNSPIKFFSKKSNYKYFFLSPYNEINFYTGEQKWYSLEHYIQAMRLLTVKGADPIEFEELVKDIIESETPKDAHDVGTSIRLDGKETVYWNSIRKERMIEGVDALYSQYQSEKDKLLSTGERELIYESKDVYWGRYNGKGLNTFGKILMDLRLKLKEEKASSIKEKKARRKRHRKNHEIQIENQVRNDHLQEESPPLPEVENEDNYLTHQLELKTDPDFEADSESKT